MGAIDRIGATTWIGAMVIGWIGGVIKTISVALKKNGSIEIATGVLLSTLNSCFAVKLAFRWYLTPLGKFALSGVLLAQKTP